MFPVWNIFFRYCNRSNAIVCRLFGVWNVNGAYLENSTCTILKIVCNCFVPVVSNLHKSFELAICILSGLLIWRSTVFHHIVNVNEYYLIKTVSILMIGFSFNQVNIILMMSKSGRKIYQYIFIKQCVYIFSEFPLEKN